MNPNSPFQFDLNRPFSSIPEEEKFQITSAAYSLLVDESCPKQSHEFYNCLHSNNIDLNGDEREIAAHIDAKCGRQARALERCSVSDETNNFVFSKLLGIADQNCGKIFDAFQVCISKPGRDCDAQIKEAMSCGAFHALKYVQEYEANVNKNSSE